MAQIIKMAKSIEVEVIEHAIDNGFGGDDYSCYADLGGEERYVRVQPDPCNILPRQFGFWFHTGPGFAPNESTTFALKVLSAPNAKVLGNDGVIVYQGNWVDSLSLNYARLHLKTCQMQRSGQGLFVRPSSRQLKGQWFLGYNPGHHNYAHWVTDGLPFLSYYQKHLMPKGKGLLLPLKHAGFLAQHIAMLNIPPEVIHFIGDEVVDIEELIHPTAFSFDRIPVPVASMLKTLIKDICPHVQLPRRKIFVSRQDMGTRCLLNEAAITDILKENGFEVVVPGNMSVMEQITTFSDASIVIGVHGAALANIIFCQPKTKVIELFPEYTVSPHFWTLASHFDLNYGAVFGTSFDDDLALISQAKSWGSPFVIDPRTIEKVIL